MFAHLEQSSLSKVSDNRYGDTDMKLTLLEEKSQKICVACGRSDVTPMTWQQNDSSTWEGILCAWIPFNKICDHCWTGFLEEVP